MRRDAEWGRVAADLEFKIRRACASRKEGRLHPPLFRDVSPRFNGGAVHVLVDKFLSLRFSL